MKTVTLSGTYVCVVGVAGHEPTARVLPGVATEWHRVKDIDERYVIFRGKGKVEVADLPAAIVGEVDLMFFAVCSPRFVQSAYVSGR